MNERTDYKAAHLTWIKRHKDFIPKGGECLTLPYIEIMTYLYSTKNCTQLNAQFLFEADLYWEKECLKIIKGVYTKCNRVQPLNCFFITLGFNHQTFTIDKAKKAINRLMATATFQFSKCNLEIHRENGLHPHLHIFTASELPKAKIVQNIWSKQYITDIVSAKNWVDVKPAESYHLPYIKLEKKPEKMKYVEMDKVWRTAEGIPDYEFGWDETKILEIMGLN